MPTGTIFPIVFSTKQWKRKGSIYLRSPPSSQKSKTERLKSKPIHLPRVVFKSEICLWEQLWVELWIEAVCYFNHKVSSWEEERWKWGWRAEALPPQVRRARGADGRTLKPTFPKLEVKQLWNIPEEEDKTLTVFSKKRHVGLILSEGKPSSELTWRALGLGQEQVTPADSLLHAAESLLGVKGQSDQEPWSSPVFSWKNTSVLRTHRRIEGKGGTLLDYVIREHEHVYVFIPHFSNNFKSKDPASAWTSAGTPPPPWHFGKYKPTSGQTLCLDLEEGDNLSHNRIDS